MSNSGGGAGPLLIFHASGLDCALPLAVVLEVVPMATLFVPPGTPSGIAGFLDLRGEAIPVVRLDLLFDLPVQLPGLHTPIIILRIAENLVGILAESVRQIVSPAPESWLPADDRNVFHDCAEATLVIDGRCTHLLAPNGILLEHERRVVAQFQAMTQQRLGHLEARQ